MGSFFRFLVRSFAFLRKEIYEILRQPRLIASLVLGPFLIMFLFGIGYRNEARPLRTIFVTQPGSPLEQQINEFAPSLGEQLIFVGTTADEEYAMQELRRGAIDLVAVTPVNAYETITNNEQAVFTLYHNEIDPFQAEYVRYFGKIYIDEVNRRVLQMITEQGQDTAVSSRTYLTSAHDNAAAMHSALEQGDAERARQHQAAMNRDLDALEVSLGATVQLLDGVQQTLGGAAANPGSEAVTTTLSDVRQATAQMEAIEAGQESYEAEAEQASEIEERLAALDGEIGGVDEVSSRVLVSPFTSEARSVAAIQPELADYFAPGVVVLLLQHLAVTFAALSIVREAQLGTIELFRVSPLSSGETLLGKYLSYMIFGGMIALILTALLIYGLGVSMLGTWANYALVVALLLFASLGIGFVISLIVETDSQAVQYAMIILLSSVFFSGFFLR
ncbi:MAG: ABC transporter permease, partial [Ardenticatenaceae bacterium]